ncbi:RHS repeat-associated core domain-containing protein [Thermomonospora curvata]|uniref:RHS repeat-associated core domain-containing protein n=1 Tax=Thermomonospora curvata TaxID=2020 RepID=UPI000A021705
MPSWWHRGSRRWRPKTTSPRPSGSPAASPSTPNGRNGLWRTLLKNHQRYYDPCIGRYLSPDPLGLALQPDPHAYVLNPTTRADLLGLGHALQHNGGRR